MFARPPVSQDNILSIRGKENSGRGVRERRASSPGAMLSDCGGSGEIHIRGTGPVLPGARRAKRQDFFCDEVPFDARAF